MLRSLDWKSENHKVSVAPPDYSEGPTEQLRQAAISPVAIFDFLFTPELWDYLVKQTNNYSRVGVRSIR